MYRLYLYLYLPLINIKILYRYHAVRQYIIVFVHFIESFDLDYIVDDYPSYIYPVFFIYHFF